MTAEQERKGLPETIAKIITALRIGDFMDVLPLGNEGFYLYSTRGAEGKIQTVTRTHVRLPKLSHLITLCPRDFFLLLNLIATAKNTQTGDSLALNPAACGVTDINNTAVGQFFTKMRVNYRINDDYCDRKWTPRDAISFLAKLEPTQENHLAAMQYLTVLQNDDILYFPIESMVNLELSWEQIDDDYCVPPESVTNHVIKGVH